jgi:hypothetical protein
VNSQPVWIGKLQQAPRITSVSSASAWLDWAECSMLVMRLSPDRLGRVAAVVGPAGRSGL